MKKVIQIVICIVFLGLMGCSNKDIKEVSNDYDWLPSVKNKDEILLYDKYDQRIVTYNKRNHNIVEKNTTQNYMQFEFNDLQAKIYTSGHSIKNHYKIIEKDNQTIKILVEMNENEAIFPLAYQNEENMYFLKSTYDTTGKEIYEKRIICQFEPKSKTLKEIQSTKGLRISDGVVSNGLLYFTVYIEANDKYELYVLNINDVNDVKLIDAELESGEIYSYNHDLWVSDKSTIYNYKDNSIQFTKKTRNYFYLNQLFQIDINNEGDLRLTIIDISEKNNKSTFDNVVDVQVDDNEINVYTLEEVLTLGVGK